MLVKHCNQLQWHPLFAARTKYLWFTPLHHILCFGVQHHAHFYPRQSVAISSNREMTVGTSVPGKLSAVGDLSPTIRSWVTELAYIQ